MEDFKKIFLIILIIDTTLISILFFYKGNIWVLNSQVAFIASLLITVASFLSYKKNILKRAKNYKIDDELGRDELDKIDDKYELFEDKEENENKDIKDIIKEEKKKQMSIKNALFNLKISFSSFLSPLKLFGYVFLILSFFYLNRHGMLAIPAFLSGFFIVPLSSLLFGFIK